MHIYAVMKRMYLPGDFHSRFVGPHYLGTWCTCALCIVFISSLFCFFFRVLWYQYFEMFKRWTLLILKRVWICLVKRCVQYYFSEEVNALFILRLSDNFSFFHSPMATLLKLNKIKTLIWHHYVILLFKTWQGLHKTWVLQSHLLYW